MCPELRLQAAGRFLAVRSLAPSTHPSFTSVTSVSAPSSRRRPDISWSAFDGGCFRGGPWRSSTSGPAPSQAPPPDLKTRVHWDVSTSPDGPRLRGAPSDTAPVWVLHASSRLGAFPSAVQAEGRSHSPLGQSQLPNCYQLTAEITDEQLSWSLQDQGLSRGETWAGPAEPPETLWHHSDADPPQKVPSVPEGTS